MAGPSARNQCALRLSPRLFNWTHELTVTLAGGRNYAAGRLCFNLSVTCRTGHFARMSYCKWITESLDATVMEARFSCSTLTRALAHSCWSFLSLLTEWPSA